MNIWTYAQLSSKVEKDLATEDELFVQPSELMGYFNAAIDLAEQEIITLYEDYFLNRATLALVEGIEEYDLPTDIYAEKIRRVIYKNGSIVYPVERVRDWKKFEQYAINQVYASNQDYRYFLYNPVAGQYKMLLTPVSRDTGNFITLWYIRTANHFVNGGSEILDIPEAANFIMTYVKVCVAAKEGHFNLENMREDLQAEIQLLNSTLANMVPDANNEIEPDLRLYREMN